MKVLDDFQYKELETGFRAIHDLKEEAKDLTDAAKDKLSSLAEVLEIEKSILTEAFASWVDEDKAGKKGDALELAQALKDRKSAGK